MLIYQRVNGMFDAWGDNLTNMINNWGFNWIAEHPPTWHPHSLSPRVAWHPLSCVGCPHGSIGIQVWQALSGRFLVPLSLGMSSPHLDEFGKTITMYFLIWSMASMGLDTLTCCSWRLVKSLGIRSGAFVPPIKEAPNRHKLWNLVAKTALSPWIWKLNYS